MNKLGLALAGVASGLKEYERLQDKERKQRMEDEQWGWKRQAAESELSLLPDHTEAVRSDYQLKHRKNNAALGLMDLQTSNAQAELELEGLKLQAAKERWPHESKVESNKAKINAALSDFDVNDLPRKLVELRQKGAINEVDMATAGAAVLGKLIREGDEQRALKFYNDVKGATGLGKGQATRIVVTEPNESGETMLLFQDGYGRTLDTLSSQKINRAMSESHKIDYKMLNPGQTLVQVSNGGAKQIYAAPESPQSAAARMSPIERDVEYLQRKHSMTPQQALAHLTSSKSMSRQQFVQKMIADKAAAGFNYKPTQQDIDEFNALYDNIQKEPEAKKPGQPLSRDEIRANLLAD